ncbi:MAG: twitching motility protein PilT [Candidatus Latescibacterota bacterium]|nr:MAG: twitching motility protein PilT [Candidatus Latescibacterota bacterium]RKY74483.1 MAG: twitching motility protein PilT [Candidatus Latescibacterota bacterium]
MSVWDEIAKLIGQVPSHVTGPAKVYFLGAIVHRAPNDLRADMQEIVHGWLMRMIQNEASDIDVGGWGCGGKVWYRIHGVKRPEPNVKDLSLEETDLLLLNLLTDSQKKYLFEHKNLDFSYTFQADGKSYRFRADMYFDLDHLALNMRFINEEIRPFKSLGFHPNVARALSLIHVKQGLTLVTGITGSGKSSTLDSIIDATNRSVDAHIVIIGAPIETVHKPIRCIIRHREVGRDVKSFKDGTIEALRQDPDIIVIGEMRDPETIMTALEVTDSGHKVFSTLHTASAVESIDRIIAEVPPIEQERVRNRLADVLLCVISQKLVPSLDGKRVLAKEVMLSTPSIKAAIKNNNTSEIYQMIAESNELGMITMEQDLRRLYIEGKISRETAMNYANNKRRMAELLSTV